MNQKTKSRPFSIMLDYLKTVDRAWLVTWIMIYVGFLVLDAFSHLHYGNTSITKTFMIGALELNIPYITGGTFIGTTILKYLGIVLNIVYARRKFHSDYILQIALAFTLLADTILCIDNVSAAGVFVFCFAQYFHTARFAGAEPKLFFYWSLALVSVLLLGKTFGITAIYVVGFIYAASLCVNIALTYQWFRSNCDIGNRLSLPLRFFVPGLLFRKPSQTVSEQRGRIASACAFYGFALFLCCDLCVLASFFSYTGVLPAAAYLPANYFSWAFYYVSQVLISNSSVLVTPEKPARPLVA